MNNNESGGDLNGKLGQNEKFGFTGAARINRIRR